MTGFLYAVGTIVYQSFTMWLALLGVLLLWDVAIKKFRRRRARLETLGSTASAAGVIFVVAMLAATADLYLLTPALGSGINFFFAG